MTRTLSSARPWILLLIVTVGCDDRASQIAREAADRQAQQNTAMAELQKEVASGAHQLVASDARAREGILDVHHDLQVERRRLDAVWTSLDADRKQVATERRTESVLTPLVTLASGTLLTALVLGFCWYVLFAASSADTDVVINQILIDEMVAGCSPLDRPIDSSLVDRTLIGK